jgi:galactokinase
MPEPAQLIQSILSGNADNEFALLYGGRFDRLEHQRRRYVALVSAYKDAFPEGGMVELFSTPGRTEVGGNHTDHNAGRVLAAAVNLDTIAAAVKTGSGIITIRSEGYTPLRVDTLDLAMRPAEKNTSTALVRGVCARMQELGFQVGGFNAYISSEVLKGSGLSSSAAYEVLIFTLLNHFYNRAQIDPITGAMISRYAENHYFGKPCGLMDQTTAAVGGFVTIDFKDAAKPVVKKVAFDFAASGYTLVIVDTGGSHADLTPEYAAAAGEMRAVAKVLGGEVLRQCTKEALMENIPQLRQKVGDRAILRALHFYNDDQRVAEQVAALEAKDFNRFLQLVNDSGSSSWRLLQNCYTAANPAEQGVTLALAVSEEVLRGRGAWRVHGGGFAGTIQAFVPDDLLARYIQTLGGIFGAKACHELMIRPVGTAWLNV